MAADGIRNVLCSGNPDALPDRQGWQAVDLSIAVVEPLAGDVPAAGGAAARLLAVLGDVTRSRGPDAPIRVGHRTKRGGEGMQQTTRDVETGH